MFTSVELMSPEATAYAMTADSETAVGADIGATPTPAVPTPGLIRTAIGNEANAAAMNLQADQQTFADRSLLMARTGLPCINLAYES